MSGREKWFFGLLTAVPVVAIAVVAVAILLLLPTNSTREPAAAPDPIIGLQVIDPPEAAGDPAEVVAAPDSPDAGSVQNRTISAGGTGTATAAPDIAEVTVGVETVADDSGAAIDENNAVMTAVTEQLLEQGLDAADVQTTGFSMWMEQVYDQSGPTGEVRFHLTNQVRAVVRDVDRVGDVLQAALDAGANNIQNVVFAVADEEALKAQARADAIANARRHAEQLAREAGVQLGEIVSISELGGSASPFDGDEVRAQSGGGGGPPISSGGYSASVSVQVVFAIAD